MRKCRQSYGIAGKVARAENVHILYEGSPLQSRIRYYWRLQYLGSKQSDDGKPGIVVGNGAFTRVRLVSPLDRRT